MSFLFVDRICHSQPGEQIVGVKQVTAKDIYLTQDDQGKPIFIPALIGETLGQLAAWNVMQANDFSLRPVAGVVAEVAMLGRAQVGDMLVLRSYIERVDEQAVQYHSEATVNEEIICTLHGAIGPMLPMETFIDPAVAREQYAAIYQPGPVPASLQNAERFTPSSSAQAEDPARIQSVLTGSPACAEDDDKRDVLTDLGTVQIWQSADEDTVQQQTADYLWVQKRLDPKAGYFADHFPHKPVLPLTLLLHSKVELAGQMVARLLPAGQTAHVRRLSKIKMRDFVRPESTLDIHLRVKQVAEQFVIQCRSEVGGKPVCVCEVHYA